MIDMKLNAFKAGFFDRKAVTNSVDKATRKVLSKFGAFVRTRARRSIRKRKGVSMPGGPPHSHTGRLRNFIFFAYDQFRRSVVIGPARLNAVASRTTLPALEYGGKSVVREGGRRSGRTRTINVKARPFMGPALEAERPKLPAMWRDSVR